MGEGESKKVRDSVYLCVLRVSVVKKPYSAVKQEFDENRRTNTEKIRRRH